jgi:hypothetical protein
MDRSSNMLDVVVNIDRYLDIGVNHSERKDELMFEDGYHAYYDYET